MNDASKASTHMILVQRRDLKAHRLSPTSEELFDLMHITSCDHAIQRWKEAWTFCPVCCSVPNRMGIISHKPKKDILI